ncbi:hypothetical protein Tco_0691374 [Tanacetum coccineum]
MSKDQSISRRNKMFWYTTRDDLMFNMIRVISRHQDTQVYGAILPNELNLTRNVLGFPKPKMSHAVAIWNQRLHLRYSQSGKKKQPASVPKAKGLKVLSKVELFEDKQMKIAIKKARHNSIALTQVAQCPSYSKFKWNSLHHLCHLKFEITLQLEEFARIPCEGVCVFTSDWPISSLPNVIDSNPDIYPPLIEDPLLIHDTLFYQRPPGKTRKVKEIIMVNVIPPNHDHDVPVVEPNQHDDVLIVPEPVLEDKDEDPEEDEFKEEEDPQEDEDNMEIENEEDENEPELTYLYEEVDPLNPPPPASESELDNEIEIDNEIENEDETIPVSVYEVGESSTAAIPREDGDRLLPGFMRWDIDSLFGNEVRSSVEQGTAAMENLVEKLENVEEKAECKKLKKELEEAKKSGLQSPAPMTQASIRRMIKERVNSRYCCLSWAKAKKVQNDALVDS